MAEGVYAGSGARGIGARRGDRRSQICLESGQYREQRVLAKAKRMSIVYRDNGIVTLDNSMYHHPIVHAHRMPTVMSKIMRRCSQNGGWS